MPDKVFTLSFRKFHGTINFDVCNNVVERDIGLMGPRLGPPEAPFDLLEFLISRQCNRHTAKARFRSTIGADRQHLRTAYSTCQFFVRTMWHRLLDAFR